jgi:hypothetical protein
MMARFGRYSATVNCPMSHDLRLDDMKDLSELTELYVADTKRRAYMLAVAADYANGSYFRHEPAALHDFIAGRTSDAALISQTKAAVAAMDSTNSSALAQGRSQASGFIDAVNHRAILTRVGAI